MRTIETEGVRIEMPDRCGCGSVCTDGDAAAHLRAWDGLLKACAFCGKPIRIAFMRLDHVHKSDVDEEGWGVTNTMEYEEHYDWSSHGPFGWFDIRAHIACAKRAMPYADFKETVYDHPRAVPEGAMPTTAYHRCESCGAKPTEEDARRVAALVYSFSGPCVYCNGPIRVFRIELFHGSRAGEHTGRWHFRSYAREASLNWWGYREGGYARLEFNGHLACALRAMPHVRWAELDSAFEMIEQTKREKQKVSLRRFLTKKLAGHLNPLQRIIDFRQLEHLLLVELGRLEGPKEWVPGLRTTRWNFDWFRERVS